MLAGSSDASHKNLVKARFLWLASDAVIGSALLPYLQVPPIPPAKVPRSRKKKTRFGCFVRQRSNLVARPLTSMLSPSPEKKKQGTMASADFCRLMLLRHSHAPRFRLTQISRVRTLTFIPCTLHIYHLAFRTAIGLRFVMQTHPRKMALYVVSVRRVGILPQASFRFRLTTDTLALG